MEPIIIPGLAEHERRQHRLQVKYGYRKPDEEEDEPKRNAVLCGLGTAYMRPHIHGGRIQMLARGCLADSIASGRVVNLQMDHEGTMVIASTANGLELDETDTGLFFRLDLRRAKAAEVITSMVDVGNRACASVAYQAEAEITETFGGHDVRVITRACLQEISIVKRGAVEEAFAFLSDDVNNPTVRGMERSTIFALDRLNHNVKRAARTHADNSADLVDRINRLSAKYGLPPI